MKTVDRALVKTWWAQELTCQDPDSTASDESCRGRDQTSAKLERRGWCWAYDDWTVVRADYRWHRCSEKTLLHDQRSVQPEEFDSSPQEAGAEGNLGSHISLAPGGSRLDTREQQREDARAAIRQRWLVDGATIQQINFAFSCGLVNRLTASVAIQHVERSMQDPLWRAGLIDDPTMRVLPVATRFMEAGKADAAAGKCLPLTPAMRGELRSSIALLARM